MGRRPGAAASAAIAGVEDKILQLFIDLVEKIGPDTTRKWCEVLEDVKKAM